ncbi:glutathione transferase omega class [Trametes sanguinea]|nr:glutathione transferase omega class [Trametes sanguinea]
MSKDKRLTLYAAVDSPFAHRVHLALEEAGAVYDLIWIDLIDKEEWFEKKVNPAGGKVPLLVYGGPKLHPADAPSGDAVKLIESVVILEFLADLFPAARLLPEDPVLRARARFFSAAIESKLLKAFMGFRFLGEPIEGLLAVLDEFQGMLPPTGFVVGEWSIADAAFSPLLARFLLLLSTGLGNFPRETGREGLEAFESPRFARLRRYYEDVMARPSMLQTWDEVTEKWAAEQEAVKATTVRRMDRFRKTGIINSFMRLPVPAT